MSFTVLTLVACQGSLKWGNEDTGDRGAPTTSGDTAARLIANVFTWQCHTKGDLNDTYEGVYGANVSLEYAPDGLQLLTLPEVGACEADLSMFPQDAGSQGAELAGVTAPTWNTDWDSGTLDAVGDGYWEAELLGNQHSCQYAEELFEYGVALGDAGSLSGITTPSAGSLTDASAGEGLGDAGLTFGEEVQVSWTEEGHAESWVQLRMEREGYAYGSVTCNTTGLDGFSIDDSVWSNLDEAIPVEVINLYVGFQNESEQITASGVAATVITRTIHVEVVQGT